MFPKATKLSALLVLFLLAVWVMVAQAQTTSTPPPTTSATTPAPTEPPAIMVIQATPVPQPPPQGSQWQQFWQTYREEIITVAIGAILGGILIGVFLKQIAEKLAEWSGRFFHFLFDRFASAPLVRWRYEKEYRMTLATAVQELQGGNLVDRQIRLDQMYVPALLTEETRPEVADFADRFRSREEMRRQQKERAVDPWEAVRRYHRFVVLGGPGAGKTTYLYHLAFMCAHRRRPEVQDHLPIFIRFRELVRDLGSLKQLEDAFPAVLANYKFPNAAGYVARRLKEGRCFILLDGLDELSNDADHQKFIELVQGFADRHVRGREEGGKDNILVVSCRVYSYEHGAQLAGFPKTEVMEFDPETVARFAHNYFTASEGYLADEMLTALNRNARFLELARNPLLLLLIAYHFKRERNLPTLRFELYKHCVQTRIIAWNTQKGTHLGRFGETQKSDMLGELALHIFQHEQQGLLPKREILLWLQNFVQGRSLPDGATPEELLDETVRTSGLIQEWAIDRYGFSHQTLQEYFAADALWQLGPEEGAARLAEYLPNPAWKEVVLLYCGRSKNAAPLLQQMVDGARQPEDGRRLWLLAGQCLAEGAQQVAEPLRREVADTLVALLREPDGLLPDERELTAANLQTFAADLLPGHIQTLLESGQNNDLFLAEQLLPKESQDEQLRQFIRDRLIDLARSANVTEQQTSIAALGRLGGSGAASVAALRAGLQDGDAPVRAEAARACAQLGQVDEAMADLLRRMCHEDKEDVARHAALAALLALGREKEVGMVLIPAGEFLMGSSDNERQAKDNEKPQHKLYLPAYFIERTPVTNAAYGRFMAAGGYAKQDYWREAVEAGRWKDGKYVDYDQKERMTPRFWNDQKWNGELQPVVGVSWYEAMAYARWAGKRLPTEAEWEKAARGIDGRPYPWGNEWQENRANTKEAGLKKTTPVGQFSPAGDSPYGVADMAGNVWEWCSTRWGFDYPYNQDDGREDLSGGDNVVRVLRGGSWVNDKNEPLCSARDRDNPHGYIRGGYGVRVVVSSFLTADR